MKMNKRVEMIKFLYGNKLENKHKDRKTPYFNGSRLYLYMGGNGCLSIKVLRSYSGKNGETLYDIDCSTYDRGLILQNVSERFIGESPRRTKNKESMTYEFFKTLTERR